MGLRSSLAPIDLNITTTIDGAAVTLPAVALPPPQPGKPPLYGGQPLFCHVQSNGQTLSIVIDDVFGADILDMGSPSFPPATLLDVTFALNHKPLAHFPPFAAQYNGGELHFTATIDSTFKHLHLFVDDNAITSPLVNDGQVQFILAQIGGGDFLVQWLRSDVIRIPNADKLTDGSVLPPAVAGSTGGVLGPMGYSSP